MGHIAAELKSGPPAGKGGGLNMASDNAKDLRNTQVLERQRSAHRCLSLEAENFRPDLMHGVHRSTGDFLTAAADDDIAK